MGPIIRAAIGFLGIKMGIDLGWPIVLVMSLLLFIKGLWGIFSDFLLFLDEIHKAFFHEQQEDD